MFHTITRPIKSPNLSELAVHVLHVHMQKSLSNFMNQGPNGNFGPPTQFTSRTRTADVSLSAQDGTVTEAHSFRMALPLPSQLVGVALLSLGNNPY